MKKNALLTLTLIVALGFFAEAAAAAEEKSVDEKLAEQKFQLGELTDRIQGDFTGWNNIDNHNLVIRQNRRDYFMLTLMEGCIGLDNSFTMTFRPDPKNLVRGSDVIIHNGFSSTPCRIEAIHRLVDLEKKERDDKKAKKKG